MAKAVNHDEAFLAKLEDIALPIYQDLSRTKSRGFDGETIAKEAIARAVPFVKVFEGLRTGDELPGKPEDRKAPRVPVHIWRVQNNQERPAFDKETQKPIIVELEGDLDAYAPNLSKDHPVNQRHYKALEALGLKPNHPDPVPAGSLN